MKNTALGDLCQDKYSTRLGLVLYLSLDMPPRAVFSIQTCGSALSNINSFLYLPPIEHLGKVIANAKVQFEGTLANVKSNQIYVELVPVMTFDKSPW